MIILGYVTLPVNMWLLPIHCTLFGHKVPNTLTSLIFAWTYFCGWNFFWFRVNIFSRMANIQNFHVDLFSRIVNNRLLICNWMFILQNTSFFSKFVIFLIFIFDFAWTYFRGWHVLKLFAWTYFRGLGKIPRNPRKFIQPFIVPITHNAVQTYWNKR